MKCRIVRSQSPLRSAHLAVLALVALLGIDSRQFTAGAAPVTFWYGGYINEVYNPSNALPFAVTEGMPFTGRITFDQTESGDSTTNGLPGAKYSENYYRTTSRFSMLLQIGGHIITNSAVPGSYTGTITVSDGYDNRDYLVMETSGGAELMLDGAQFTTRPIFSTMTVQLDDNTRTALSNPGVPTAAPDLAKFQDFRSMYWGIQIDDGIPTSVTAVRGEVTALSTNEIVMLTETRAPGKSLVLSWPLLNVGYTLQSTTNLASPNWQTVTNPVVDAGRLHTVTVPTTVPRRFFRLKK